MLVNMFKSIEIPHYIVMMSLQCVDLLMYSSGSNDNNCHDITTVA